MGLMYLENCYNLVVDYTGLCTKHSVPLAAPEHKLISLTSAAQPQTLARKFAISLYVSRASYDECGGNSLVLSMLLWK